MGSLFSCLTSLTVRAVPANLVGEDGLHLMRHVVLLVIELLEGIGYGGGFYVAVGVDQGGGVRVVLGGRHGLVGSDDVRDGEDSGADDDSCRDRAGQPRTKYC